MTALSFNSFLGMSPRTYKQLLPNGFAQIACNCRLTDGTLSPLRAPLLVNAPSGVTGEIKTLWRLASGATEYFLTWTRHVDIVRSPIYPDRIYWTGDGAPKQTDFAGAIVSAPYPNTVYALGIPTPTAAPTVSASGGSAAATTRAYVWTRMDAWGQESGPSPATTVTGKLDDTWTISGFEAVPVNSGSVTAATHSVGVVTVNIGSNKFVRVGEELRFASIGGMTDLNGTFPVTGLVSTDRVTVSLTPAQTYTSGGTWTRAAPFITAGMKKYLYRALKGEFFFLADVSGSSYTDTTTDADLALNSGLPSLTWDQPPTDLKGLAVLANGSMASISGSTVLFSEPGYPHAWPKVYTVQLGNPGVNLKAIDNTVIVATTGATEMIVGSEPISMTPIPHQAVWPCATPRAMTKGAYGVEFPCPEGLVLFGSNGGDVATRGLFTEVEWSDLKPETFISAHHAGRYYFAYTNADDAAMLILQRGESASMIKASVVPTAIYACEENAKLYLAIEGKVYEWDADPGILMQYDWWSGEVKLPGQIRFVSALVDADFSMSDAERAAAQASADSVSAANQSAIGAGDIGGAIGGDALGTVTLGGDHLPPVPPVNFEQILFQYYVDGALKWSHTVLDRKSVFKIPKYSKSDTYSVRISGNVRVRPAVSIAQSSREVGNS
jgi:hypothetical protein